MVYNIEESSNQSDNTAAEELFQKLDPCHNHLEAFEDSDRIVIIENENQIILAADFLRSNSFVNRKLKIDLRVSMEEKRAKQQGYSRQSSILEKNLDDDDDFQGDFILMKALAKSEDSEFDLNSSIDKNVKNNENININPDVSGDTDNCHNIVDETFLKNILEKISEIEPQSNLKVENNDLMISTDELPQSGFAKLLSELRLKLFS